MVVGMTVARHVEAEAADWRYVRNSKHDEGRKENEFLESFR